MVRKLKERATPEQHVLLDAVRSSAQQIWQAGLGAFAKAQQEGSEMFDKLVQDGSELHRLTQFLPGGGAGMADKVSNLAGSMSKQATGSWDKLEKIFEDRVARAMRSLGVPSQDDVESLRAEIAGLKEAMAASAPARQAPRKAAARPAAKPSAKAAPKPAAKPAAKSVAKSVAKAARKSAGKAAKKAAPRARAASSAR